MATRLQICRSNSSNVVVGIGGLKSKSVVSALWLVLSMKITNVAGGEQSEPPTISVDYNDRPSAVFRVKRSHVWSIDVRLGQRVRS
jgi:hypothetical protein